MHIPTVDAKYVLYNPETHFLHQTFCLSLVQEQFSEVLDAMFEVLVQPQEHVIDQGEDGDNFYVIERYIFLKTVLYVLPVCVCDTLVQQGWLITV